jgi:tetratricopeptide (TPR) repeat protein/transglutaminase-like putative cysteine protease
MKWKTRLAVLLLSSMLPVALAQTNSSEKAAPAASGQEPSKPDSSKIDSGKADSSQADASKQGSAKAQTSKPDYSKEGYVIERWHTRIREENDGTGTREREVEVRLLSEAGLKAFAVLAFPYTTANETIEFDYVRVRKPDGTVVKTPDYNIQDMPAEVTRSAPLYSDIHEKHVAVKGLSVGDVLEYLVRVRVTKPEVPGQFWHEYSFGRDMIVKDERLELNVPSEKYMKVVSPEFKPETTQEGTRRVYRWAHANLAVKEKDPDEIPRRIPPNPDVQITTFTSWEEVGRWYDSLQKDPLQVTAAIQAKAEELTKALKTEDEKIHAIYNFVSLKFHYIGLDFGIGRYQPHAADDVLDNGYGDCKDKHTLLASLLKAEGIEAWPALIHASRKLDAEVPSPAQFNHVITVVPRGGSFLWLDTTPEVAPYGLLLLTLRDKQALVIPTHELAKLVTTPADSPEPQRQEFSMQGKLSADGTFTGHAEQSYQGDAGVLFRMIFRRVPESQWRDAEQRLSYAMNFMGDVSNVKASPPDEIDKPFTVSYDYVRKNYSDWDNHRITAPLPPMGMEVTKDSKEKKPQEPVLLGAVGKLSYRSRVELPEGYYATAPAKCHLVEPYAEYAGNTVIEGQAVTTTRELVIKKREVALSDWEEFRKFGRSLNDDEFNYIQLNAAGALESKAGGAKREEDKNLNVDDMFREGSNALQRRDFQRAQELFQKIIASNPNYKGAHFNLGLALASQNKPTDALEQFRKEESVSPEDPRPYQAAAALVSFRGSRDDAIQEWRKLLKVDPKNRTTATTLGRLLYDTGKYSEAVDVLEAAVKDAPDSPGLLMDLGNAYLKTGQNEKAVARLRAAVELQGDEPMIFNNVAYTLAENKAALDLAQQYAERAVELLDKQIQEAESSQELRATYHETGLRVTYQLSLTWDTLGWVYFQQGDAKRAESFVRPAWLLGEESVVAEHLGEIYEKEGKTQQAARVYSYALAVSSVPAVTFGVQPDAIKAYKERNDEIKARYKKLTGRDPSLYEIRRLPNGEWTQTPAEELRHLREAKLANEHKLSGSAQFIVTFKPGKVESAEYDTGDDELRPLADKLKAVRYPLEFPPDSRASLVVRVQVSCKPTAACVATLVNPVAAGPQFPQSPPPPPAYPIPN